MSAEVTDALIQLLHPLLIAISRAPLFRYHRMFTSKVSSTKRQ